MVYNRQYNTRHSTGRYNTPGQFVPGGNQQQNQQNQQQNEQNAQSQYSQPPSQQFQTPPPFAATPSRNSQHHPLSDFPLQTPDIDMTPPSAPEVTAEDEAEGSDDPLRPAWMKSKLLGLKKISKKEKRRRQNEHLRRLITPKNALMVLNEMMQHDQLANQFKVEPAAEGGQYCKVQKTNFCADLTLEGVTYKGYGENKLTARNAAAEQAIRDVILRRMSRPADLAGEVNRCLGSGGGEAGAGAEVEAEDPLPMIQLASFALHKLFAEWEYEGHKVPNLKPPPPSSQTSEVEAELGAGAGGGARGQEAEGAAEHGAVHAPVHAAVVHAAAPGVPRAGRGRRPPAEHALHHGRRRRRSRLHRESVQQEGGAQGGGARGVPGAVRAAARRRARARRRRVGD